MAGLLGACSSEESSPPATIDAAEGSSVKASGAEASGVGSEEGGARQAGLPFDVGPWDENDPNFQFFDPCTDIAPEVLAGAGLVEPEEEPVREEGGFASCYFLNELQNGDHRGTLVILTSDLVPKDKYNVAGIKILEGVDESGIALVEEADRLGASCSTSMVTSRGRWGVEVSYVGDGKLGNECEDARKIHNLLLKGMEK